MKMNIPFSPRLLIALLTTLMFNHAASNPLTINTENSITDNHLAPKKIKSINQIKKVQFQGDIYWGCGKSIFNPLYQNHHYRNQTKYPNLNQIFDNNTAILISVNHVQIYANTIRHDESFCSLKKDVKNAEIQAYIVSVTAENGQKADLIYLINYKQLRSPHKN